jgi:hypothetical protein
MTDLSVPAKWTDDCQGKKDYDGDLVTLSVRYWPRGGGFHVLDTGKGTFEGNEARPQIRPSAHATIYLGSTADEFYDNAVELAKREFDGDTQEEVQRAVEAWALEQYQRIAAALRTALSGGVA